MHEFDDFSVGVSIIEHLFVDALIADHKLHLSML